MAAYSRARRAAAWSVHAYTATGLPMAIGQVWALERGDSRTFWLLQCLALLVDATDGMLARAVEVKKVVPSFDGRKLDDIVDFLTFSFLPALALVGLGLVPEQWWPVCALPVLASGYGFCQDRAKTEDSFVGFPSYWNIVLFYLWLLEASAVATVAVVVALSVLVFVPIHYVYPTRAPYLRRITVSLGFAWGAVIAVLAAAPGAPWARAVAWGSLAYPVYYTVLSGFHHVRVTRATRIGS
jgi:phosphatidylcholine synthase